MSEAAVPMKRLSKREVEVIRYLMDDLSQKEISMKMGISSKTVSSYICRAREKVGVRSTVALVVTVIELKIL